MKKSSTWCVLSLLLVTSFAWSQSGAEKAVTDAEMQWLQSQKTNNPDLLAPLLADKLVDTSADGKVADKKEALAQAKGIKWTSVSYDGMKVMVFGNAAVAVGEFNGKGTDDKGKAVDEHERFTDTWVKMPNGKWECVATQTTAIKM